MAFAARRLPQRKDEIAYNKSAQDLQLKLTSITKSWCVNFLGALAIALSTFVLLSGMTARQENLIIIAEASTTAGTEGEVFFAKHGEDYAPDWRVPFALVADGHWRTYRIEIPRITGLRRIRIDPGGRAGVFSLRSITLESADGRLRMDAKVLETSMRGEHDALKSAAQEGSLSWTLNAPDPYLDFLLPPEMNSVVGKTSRLGELVVAALAGIVWLGWTSLGWPAIRRRCERMTAPAVLKRAAAYCSDEGVLHVSPMMLAIVAALILAAAIYVLFRINQSSIGVWEKIYPAHNVEQFIDIGTPRRIRSDEWNTQSPWVLSQVARGMQEQNLNIGGVGAPLLAAVPVKDPTALAQPEFYGFHLFDLETGFSWWWACKTFGILLSFFWLTLVLSRGNMAAALFAPLWIYGSSFTQWWLSSSLPELMTAFAVATLGVIYLLFGSRLRWVVCGGVMAALASVNLALHPYPPFIIPLAYLALAIIVGLACDKNRLGILQARLLLRITIACAAIVVSTTLMLRRIHHALPAIDAMLHTSYPGKRVSASGEFPFIRLLGGYFEAFRIGEDTFPFPPGNASEAAGFIILLPLLLFALPLHSIMRRQASLLIAIGVYCTFTLLWMCAELPFPIQSLFQAAGWSWVPGPRAMLGLGIGSILATTLLFACFQDRSLEPLPGPARWMLVALTPPILLLLGGWLHAVDPAFFRGEVILLGILAVTFITAAVMMASTRTFAVGLALAIAAPLTVNPVMSGLSSIQHKPILMAAAQYGKSGTTKWAVIGDFIVSQGFKAQGLDVVTGSQIIPNKKMASILDPTGLSASIWNRYAHIVFQSLPSSTEPQYQLLGPDIYAVSLDVCGNELTQIGVSHIAYTVAVPPQDLHCLRELNAPSDSGIRLFELLPLNKVP